MPRLRRRATGGRDTQPAEAPARPELNGPAGSLQAEVERVDGLVADLAALAGALRVAVPGGQGRGAGRAGHRDAVPADDGARLGAGAQGVTAVGADLAPGERALA